MAIGISSGKNGSQGDVIIRDGVDTGYKASTGERVIGEFLQTDKTPTGDGVIIRQNTQPSTPVTPVIDNWQGGNTNTVTPTNSSTAAPTNPCLKLEDYGYVLWNMGFQWKDEFLSWLTQPSVTKIAAFDSLTFNYVVEERNIELNGQKYIIQCTPYYIRDYLCKVASVKFTAMPRYNVSIAKYIINDGAVTGEFYITTDGRLCKLILVPVTPGDGDDFGGGDTPPPPSPPTTPSNPLGSGQVFFPIYADDVISDIKDIETKALWSDETSNLKYHFIDTSDTSSYNYQINVNHLVTTDSCSAIQYQAIYADYDGKGDRDLGGFDNETITKAMYTQFAHVLLPHGQEKFIISGSEVDYVYIVKVMRDRYKTALDPGNWELPIAKLTDGNGATTGSSSIPLIASQSSFSGSYIYVDSTTRVNDVKLTNKVYDVVHGTLEDGVLVSGSVIGNFYPNHGAIVLSGPKMDTLFTFNTNRNVERNGYNAYRLFSAISASSAPDTYTDASGDAVGFKGRRLEITHNKMFFIRVKNFSFNYSNNPTYVTGSEGVIIDDFLGNGNERVYISTIGLYDQHRELLAVGKCSQPVIKSPTEEALFTVKVGL